MRERIVQSAGQEILKYGFRKFTIDDLASNLGISKKTIYKYFNSKNEIICSVLDDFLEMDKDNRRALLASSSGTAEKLQAMLSSSLQTMVPTWLLGELQQYFPEEWAKCEIVIEFQKAQMIDIVKAGIDNGELRPEIDPALLDGVLHASTAALLDYRFLTEHDLTLDQALNKFLSLIFYGILNNSRNEG
ncbi:transcriptional regulator, tetr family [hydrocarbon metagenome]|uniref:Transcriptional regulator, tetr family n=1 Tax=hydrocarbon metagenome TaxID=938273 RepID=A0A0W8E8Z7_9ZZZZ